MKMNNIIPQILAACLFLGSASAVEFFDGVTPVTAGVIDITNDKLLFSDVSQAVGNRTRNITPLILRQDLGLRPGVDIQAFSPKLSGLAGLADGAGVLTNNGGGVYSWSTGASGATNLSAAAAATTVTVFSDTGNDAVIPVPDGTNAGVMLAAEKIKLSGIATGATANSADAVLLAWANQTGKPATATAAGWTNGSTLDALGGGNGSTLSSLNASNISSGTLADGRLPGTMSNKTLPSATLTNTTYPVSAQSGTVLDFSGDPFKVCTLSTNTIFTTANLAAGKSLTVRITGGASVWSTTFPAWAFVGASAPSNIAIGKVGILTITSFGTTDADCVAAFAVQP